MSYIKHSCYRDIPFSSETASEDFTTYDIVRNLHTKCDINKDKIIKIRTVGLLESKNGCFYITELPATSDVSASHTPMQSMQVSMAYMHQSIKASVMPYPVQILGKLQWKGIPVIYAQIVQPLRVAVAIMLHNTLLRTVANHCHRHSVVNDSEYQ